MDIIASPPVHTGNAQRAAAALTSLLDTPGIPQVASWMIRTTLGASLDGHLDITLGFTEGVEALEWFENHLDGARLCLHVRAVPTYPDHAGTLEVSGTWQGVPVRVWRALAQQDVERARAVVRQTRRAA